ncbi:MAG: DrmE family protein [Pyrinomonadaceae bacterium]
MDWNSLTQDIVGAYPFLASAQFGLIDKGQHYSMPPLLIMGAYAAVTAMNADTGTRSALIFPHSTSIACQIAASAALGSIAKQFRAGLPALPELLPGEKVLLDGVDYIYLRNEVVKGTDFMVFNYQGGIQKVPASQRLRVQHSISQRQLTKRDRYPIASVIDPILSTPLRGNTSLFRTAVILVAHINQTRERVADLSLSPDNNLTSKLSSAFGWGSLSDEGEVRLWGSAGRREEPVVLVSSNFADVCEYVDVNPRKVDLVIVDGTRSLNDLSSFESLLERQIPFLFVLSGKDQESIPFLTKRGFCFWAWNADDLTSLQSNSQEKDERSPFFDVERKLDSFAEFAVDIIGCCNPAFDSVFSSLQKVRERLNDDDFYASDVFGKLYGVFLRASRIVSTSETVMTRLAELIASVNDDLETFENFLEADLLVLLHEAINALGAGIADLSADESKPALMNKEIQTLKTAGYKSICVVLNKSDFDVERDTITEKFPGGSVVFEKSSTFKGSDEYDCVVLCGYLRGNQMLRVFDKSLGSRVIVFNYTHEKEWTNSTKRKFFGSFDTEDFRNPSVFGKRQLAIANDGGTGGESPEKNALEDFEIRLHELKRLRILRGLDDEASVNKVAARCVMFNQGGYAFLTDGHSVPVINELMSAGAKPDKLPQRKIKDISIGDFLLFRESSSRNIIRELADLGLERSGNAHLRELATRWRPALTTVFEKNGRSLSRVKAVLSGFGCDRNELTIKNWLQDENQIAPGDDADLLAIAEAAGDDELMETCETVVQAVSQVRGAHIQASKQVARLLDKRIKGDLQDLSETDAVIKVAGLGNVFIVCVESIDSSVSQVAAHKVNRLLRER